MRRPIAATITAVFSAIVTLSDLSLAQPGAPIELPPGKQILRNWMFDSWSNGKADEWSCSPATGAAQRGDIERSMTQMLEIRPAGDGKFTTMYQNLDAKAIAGKRITLAFYAQCGESDALALAVRYKRKGSDGETLESVSHSGNGEWEKTILELEVPADIEDEGAAVRLVVRPKATQPALVDWIACVVANP